jgi:hypothetical protein
MRSIPAGIHVTMSSQARPAATTRTQVVADLFDALEGLLIAYHALPEQDRAQRWSGDADRITGLVARHLAAARTRLSSTFAPSTDEKIETPTGPPG